MPSDLQRWPRNITLSPEARMQNPRTAPLKLLFSSRHLPQSAQIIALSGKKFPRHGMKVPSNHPLCNTAGVTEAIMHLDFTSKNAMTHI